MTTSSCATPPQHKVHVFFDGFDGLHTGETQVLQSVNHTGHQFVRYGGTRGDTYGFQTLEPCRVKLAGIIHAIRLPRSPKPSCATSISRTEFEELADPTITTQSDCWATSLTAA